MQTCKGCSGQNREWRNTNSQQDFRAFKVAPNHHTTYLMNSARRRDYFSNVIVKTSSNKRKLFLTTSSLLFEPTDVSFPCQITYLPIVWLIILATILYRRLNVSMTHWTPFSHLSLLTAMTMRPQITWAHAQTVLILIRANVQSSQTSRPWHKAKFLWLLETQPWNLVL